MNSILLELIVILALLLANGVFAMTEIAVVSARKSRLHGLASAGDARARAALELAESPNRFLSTVQIGITLVGIFAGAFGGATLAEELAKPLMGVTWLAPYAEAVSLGGVVLAITYLSLVIGELVPKRLGLARPEGVAMAMARPMQRLSVFAGPLVSFLSFSTDALFRSFGVKSTPETAVSEEEVKGLLREGLRAGSFNQVESQMVESVLELDRLPVRDLMTPRAKIIWINVQDSHESIWHKIVVSGHTHFPVYQGDRDHVAGIVSLKAIYAHLAAGLPVKLPDLVVPPLIVPATQNAVQVLETFKQTGKHIALVSDEFGGFVGMVTLHDLVEAIVGDFPSPDERQRPAAKRRDDGTWLVDAMIEIERLQSALPQLEFGEPVGRDFQTLAGFVVKHLGHIPKEGETFEHQGFVFEVLDMDRHRVDKILLVPLAPGKAATPT